MSLASFDDTIQSEVQRHSTGLAEALDGTVVFYAGPLVPPLAEIWRDFLEDEKQHSSKDRLIIVLNTPGGIAEVVERMVEIMRHHYREVYFIVRNYALSAGTILCMSGNKIYMDYASALGPIDPQIESERGLVPAMGYLDHVDKLVDISMERPLSQAEVVLLNKIDPAQLNMYEQQRDLTIDLLETWLVRYKFQTWTHHRTDTSKLGKPVTDEEKQERAQAIGQMLSDNKQWHSHGRRISANTLRTFVRLEIEDYYADNTLRDHVRTYHDLLVDYREKGDLPFLLYGETRGLS